MHFKKRKIGRLILHFLQKSGDIIPPFYGYNQRVDFDKKISNKGDYKIKALPCGKSRNEVNSRRYRMHRCRENRGIGAFFDVYNYFRK